MGKNNIAKKGKQKEPTARAHPPSSLPPEVASPPAAHHIQYPSAPIDPIEEQEEETQGELYSHPTPSDPLELAVTVSAGGPVEGIEDESWQNVSHSADGWMADVPGNSNGDLDADGWETGVSRAPMSPLPPQSVQKIASGRDNPKAHYPQKQSLPPTGRNGSGFGTVPRAHKSLAMDNLGYARPQQLQGAWTRENSGTSEDDRWGGQDSGDEWSGDGWNGDNSRWDQQPHSATWSHAVSARFAHSQPRSRVSTGGWQSWSEEARRLTIDPATSSRGTTRGKPVLSQLQRSQILDNLLNNPQQNYPVRPVTGSLASPAIADGWRLHQYGKSHPQQQSEHPQSYANPQMAQTQDNRGQQEDHDVWGLGDGWNDSQEEEEEQGDSWGPKVHFSPDKLRASMLPSSAPSTAPSTVVENFTVNGVPQNKLGLSAIPMSKTLSLAYSGSTPSTESEPGRAAMQRISDFQFVESRGEALKGVQRAFYDKQRKAADRFHWLFSPEKDERVSSLLNWINSMSFGIASFGLQKFLQTRERGALIINAAYRPVHSPTEPVFDWVTWTQIQRTMDRTLQVSVGYYNPAVHIIVFVLLPSSSGNSVAIWRRKLPIPNNIRLAYQAQITQAMASLLKEYKVLVDELPPPPEQAPPPPPKKKRKWYKLWLFS